MTSLHHPPATALPARCGSPGTAACSPLGAGARVVGLDPDTALVVDGLPPPLAALLDRLDRPGRTAELVARPPRRAAYRPTSPDELLAQLRRRRGRWSTRPPSERAARAPGGRAWSACAAAGRSRSASSPACCTAASARCTPTPAARCAAPISAPATPTPIGAASGWPPPRPRCGGSCRRPARGRRRCGRARISSSSPTRRPSPALVDAAARPRRRPPRRCACATASGVVGPLVYPGRTACLGCLDLHRAATSTPRWPAVAAQLAGRAGVGRSGRRHRHGRARRRPRPSRPSRPSTAGPPARSAPRSSSTSTRASLPPPHLERRIRTCPVGGARDRASQRAGDTIMR